MTTSVKIGLELLANAAANQTLANTTFAQLDQLVQSGAVDKDLATPPGSPTNGALYIVAAAATGAWSGKTGQLAYWLTSVGAWTFIVPRAGWAVRVLDELDASSLPLVYGYTGSAWALQASGGVSLAAVQTFSGGKTLALSDINTYNISLDAGAQAVTVPAQATVAWTADAEIHIQQGAVGAVTITGATGVTVNGISAGSVTLAGIYTAATLKRTASNTWTLVGGLANSLVSGPSSAGDGNLVLFDGTTGKLLEDGGVITAAGKALLDDTDATAQRTTLGLGSAATATVTTTASDTTAGRILKVADFGIGGTLTSTVVDLNSYTAGGKYLTPATGLINLPSGWGQGRHLVEVLGGSAYTTQTINGASANVGRKATRTWNNVTWSTWAEGWHSLGANVATVDTASLGFATGSGGTVTQATDKSTGVTLNKPSGQITTTAAALLTLTSVSFTLTNSKIAADDVVALAVKSGATAGAYTVTVDAVAAGSCRISIRNMTAGTLSETLVVSFVVIKGASS